MDRIESRDPPALVQTPQDLQVGDPAAILRTVIVDDHEVLRAGTRGILEEASGFSVVGEAANAEEAFGVVADAQPDLVITDIRLPSLNGIEFAARLVDDAPHLVVVILSAYDDEHYVRASMAAGVAGYLLKTMPSHELVSALRDACRSRQSVIGGLRGSGEKDPNGRGGHSAAQLTIRETEVVRLVARGMSNKAIARQLNISPRTVEGHLNHVFEKLGIFSRTELVHVALANSLFVRDATVVEPTDPSRHGLP